MALTTKNWTEPQVNQWLSFEVIFKKLFCVCGFVCVFQLLHELWPVSVSRERIDVQTDIKQSSSAYKSLHHEPGEQTVLLLGHGMKDGRQLTSQCVWGVERWKLTSAKQLSLQVSPPWTWRANCPSSGAWYEGWKTTSHSRSLKASTVPRRNINPTFKTARMIR